MTGGTKGASFEEGFNRKVLTGGRLLINQLAILVKLGQMHDLKNVAVEKAADALMGTLRLFFEDRGSFAVYLVGDYFYIEDNRVKYNVEDFSNFDFLVGEFKKRKLGALSFNPQVSTAEIVTFAGVFLKANVGSDEVYHEMAHQLGGAGVAGLATDELKPPKATEEFEKILDTVKAARRAYVRVILRVKEMLEVVERGQPPDIRKLKRAVQSLVDSAYKNEPVLIRLSAIRRDEEVLTRHFANVCILALGIGKRLGLSKYQMARLGMAALLHDIGRQSLPGDLLEGAPEMDDSAWGLIRRHPRLGVQTILKLKGLNEVAVSAMIVAYEHHRNMDGTGYPENLEGKEMGLFSRIVRIADNYDATTSSGVYGKIPMPPDKALSLMLGRSGQYYDHDLLRLFAGMMGVYPVGGFVLLSDGSLGVVSSPARASGGLDRPAVTLIQGPGGAKGSSLLDLAEKDESGGHRLSVVRSLDPYEHRVNIYKYLA